MTKEEALKVIEKNYGFIKGRLAEGIVERLFFSLGIDVYPVGLEVKNPHVAQLRSQGKIKTQTIEKFEYGPDFLLCQHIKEDDQYNLFEIEVKFRQRGEIPISELNKYKDPNILFVFLNTKSFYCIQNKELKQKTEKNKNLKKLLFKDCELLREHKIFNFSKKEKEIIHAFSFLIEASLKPFISQKKLSDLVHKQYQNFHLDLKNKFNTSKDKE